MKRAIPLNSGGRGGLGVYRVERLLEERAGERGCQFLVRWAGYTSDHDTWEHEEDIVAGAKGLIAQLRNGGAVAQEAEDEWVACDLCGKWRKLPSGCSAPSATDVEWTCSMNPDAARASCDADEEQWEEEDPSPAPQSFVNPSLSEWPEDGSSEEDVDRRSKRPAPSGRGSGSVAGKRLKPARKEKAPDAAKSLAQKHREEPRRSEPSHSKPGSGAARPFSSQARQQPPHQAQAVPVQLASQPPPYLSAARQRALATASNIAAPSRWQSPMVGNREKAKAEATAAKAVAAAEEAAAAKTTAATVHAAATGEIIVGASVWYRHRVLGWLAVCVTKVDQQGSLEAGGATYCVTHASLDGEVETVRERLHVHRPSEPEAVGAAEAAGAAVEPEPAAEAPGIVERPLDGLAVRFHEYFSPAMLLALQETSGARLSLQAVAGGAYEEAGAASSAANRSRVVLRGTEAAVEEGETMVWAAVARYEKARAAREEERKRAEMEERRRRAEMEERRRSAEMEERRRRAEMEERRRRAEMEERRREEVRARTAATLPVLPPPPSLSGWRPTPQAEAPRPVQRAQITGDDLEEGEIEE